MASTRKEEIKLIAGNAASGVKRKASPPTNQVLTCQLPLALCVSCCSTLKHLVDIYSATDNSEIPKHMLDAMAAAILAEKKKEKSDNNSEENENEKEIDDEEEEEEEEIESPTTTTNKTSFFSELPSVLPIELPISVCSDVEAIRLFVEYHTGNQHQLFEMRQVNNWGSEKESSDVLDFSSSSSQQQQQQQGSSQNQKNMKSSLRERYGKTSSSSSSSVPSNPFGDDSFYSNPIYNETNNSASRNRSRSRDKKKSHAVATKTTKNENIVATAKTAVLSNYNPTSQSSLQCIRSIEHGVLNPLFLQDRNPAAIFSSCSSFSSRRKGTTQQQQQQQASSSSGKKNSSQQQQQQQQRNVNENDFNDNNSNNINNGILPSWERSWVQDNFLALHSPACCVKAAKVAALAEFLGCVPLTQLMACVMASRLCERGQNSSTEHMQWCFLGKNEKF